MKKLLLSLALLLGLAMPAAAQQTNAQTFNLVTGNCRMRSGAGSPEGSVTGHICDTYLRSDGSTNTTLYVKMSGTGNTGWIAPGAGSSSWTNPMTSSAVAAILSDETGSGALVFATSPTFNTSLFAPKIYGGTGANGTLQLITTSGTGDGSGAIKFGGGVNGATLIATFNNDGSALFSGLLQSQNFTTTGFLTTGSYIRAGAADATSPAAGDIIANRGGNPGTGVVFFGGSANAHYLYYDGTNFNFVGNPLVVPSLVASTSVNIGATSTYGFTGLNNGMTVSGGVTQIKSGDGGAYLLVANGGIAVNSATLTFATSGTNYFNFAMPSSPATGLINWTNAAGTAGVGFDLATDALLKVRVRAQNAYATVDVLGLKASGVAGASGSGTCVVTAVVNGIVTGVSGC